MTTERRNRNSPSDSGGSSHAGFAGTILILAFLVLAGGFLVVSRKRGRRRRAEQFAEAKEQARDDLVALGEDIRALDLDVELPGLDPQARADYGRAVDAYDRANHVFETARTRADNGGAHLTSRHRHRGRCDGLHGTAVRL